MIPDDFRPGSTMKAWLIALLGAPLFAQVPQLPTYYTINADPAAPYFGNEMCLLDDVDLDGVHDLATPARWQAYVNLSGNPFCSSCFVWVEIAGVRVYSGRTGALLF